MRNLVNVINTIVLMSVVLIYLLAHLSPYESGEVVSAPASDLWAQKIFYQLDVMRHDVAQYIEAWHNDFMKIYSQQLKVLAVGLIGLNILSWTVSSLVPKRKQDKISIEVDGGTVSITLRALEDSLSRILKSETYVKDSKIIVRPHATRIDVSAYLTLIENPNLHSLEEEILQKMQQHLKTLFAVSKPINYEVVIHKLRPSSLPPAPVAPLAVSPLPAERPPVAQPRYPDGKD